MHAQLRPAPAQGNMDAPTLKIFNTAPPWKYWEMLRAGSEQMFQHHQNLFGIKNFCSLAHPAPHPENLFFCPASKNAAPCIPALNA